MKKNVEYFIFFMVRNREELLQHIVEVAIRSIMANKRDALPKRKDETFMGIPIRDLVAIIPFEEFKEIHETFLKGKKDYSFALVLREYIRKEFLARSIRQEGTG